MPAKRTRDCRPSRRPIQPSRAAAGRLPGASGAGHPAAAPETVPADGDGPRDASRAALSAGPRAAPLRPPRWPPADERAREPAAQPPLGRRQLRRPRRGPTSRRPLPQRAGAVASVPRPVVPAHRRRTSVPPSDSSRPPLCLWCGCAASSAARLRPARALASQRCGSESASAAAAAAASAAAAAVEAPRAAAKQNTKKKDRRRGRQKGLRRAPRPLASRAPSAPPARPHISCSASGGGGRGPAARRHSLQPPAAPWGDLRGADGPAARGRVPREMRHETRIEKKSTVCGIGEHGDVGCAHTRRLLVDKVNVISPSQSEVTRCALQTSPVRDTARTTGAHDRRDTAHRLEQWAAHTATGPQRTVPSPLRLAIAADRSLRVPRSHTASPIGARRRCVRAAQLCSR